MAERKTDMSRHADTAILVQKNDAAAVDDIVRGNVDVIIPTYRPGRKFFRLLEMLEKQTVRPRKIIVINTEEKYLDAASIESPRVEVHHIRKEEFDHGATRNLGVSYSDAAEAPYFLLMTDDAVPKDAHLIENLLAAFSRDAKIASVYGRQLPTEESGFDEVFARGYNYPAESRVKSLADLPTLGIKTYFQSDVCCMYRRDVFDALGGFIDHTIFNEDMIFACRVMHEGYKTCYAAEAEVYHAHHYSGLQQLHRNFDLGVSQADHPEVFAEVPSEGEGARMVLRNAAALLKSGRPWLLLPLVYRSGCKLLGYRLGKAYRRLPAGMIRRLTMSPGYWRKELK